MLTSCSPLYVLSSVLHNVRFVKYLTKSIHSSFNGLCAKKIVSLEAKTTSSTTAIMPMRVLNVAEKNDAAKNLARFMANGQTRMREGYSKYNKIYEWDFMLFNQQCKMSMTSVSGHLLNYDFDASVRNWQAVNPLVLFGAPVKKVCSKNYIDIKRTLEREVRGCEILIIWTDGDREGENIGFEIIDTCKAIKPNIQVYRAIFSEITARSVERAIRTLEQPNKAVSNAVDVRQELDLRIGAAFTRLQTLRLQRIFPEVLSNMMISYGSCQFPTLGFVVERYKANQEFIPEPFWKLKVTHKIGELTVEFLWQRGRLYEQETCRMYYEDCVDNPEATVESIQSKPKSKWRPLPLDTVEMEKLGSRKLRIGAKEMMSIAEKLYTKGFISYPRTETNIFPKEIDLPSLVEMQVNDRQWGPFASRVLADGPNPRAGKKSDKAHPPIHPTKYTDSLGGNEQKVYEFIVRHFLACCSKDAEGKETIVHISISDEKFSATGLMIIQRNYLDVYPYDRWSSKEIHEYQVHQKFQPTSIDLVDGETSPPDLLTEADLIALMEKHGIGTDATHAEHIEKIKDRKYVGMEGIYFVPGQLGMGLVEGYDSICHDMNVALSKPLLRAELENGLKDICEGRKDPAAVLREQIAKYKSIFEVAVQRAVELDRALGKYFNEPGRGGGNQAGGGGGGGGGGGPPPRPPPPPPAPNNPPPARARDNALPGVNRINNGNQPRSPVLCKCGVEANRLRVHKDGVNQGRFYHKCGDNKCDFWAWEQPDGSVPPVARVAPTASNQNTSSYNGNRLDDASNKDVYCNCNVQAIRRITQRGSNQGRPYYGCAKQMDDPGKCVFFLWDDVPNGGQQRNDNSGRGGGGAMGGAARQPAQRPGASASSNAHSGDDVVCNCGVPAIRRITQQGQNVGRPYYVCPKNRDDPQNCKFFLFDDSGGGQTNSNYGGDRGGGPGMQWGQQQGPRTMGRGWGNKPDGDSAPGTRKRRKCGVCHEEGHTRNKCPKLGN